MSAEKEIKTKIQNSTLNWSFDALLKWHDPHISREFIDDNQEETPSDGESESEETESRDGDRDAFSQRKEEKTIDYYKLPRGKARDQYTDWTVNNVKIVVVCIFRLEPWVHP